MQNMIAQVMYVDWWNFPLVSVLGLLILWLYSRSLARNFKAKKNPPEWLNSLRSGGDGGDSPLLSSAEWDFLAEIYSRIVDGAKNRPDCSRTSEDEDEKLKHRLSRMKDNFKEVVDYLKKCPRPRSLFMKHYPKWRYVRERNIAKLLEIAESVEKTGKNCLIASLIGKSVSVTGAILSLTAADDKRPLFDLLRTFGGAVSAGTSVCEAELLREKVQKAEKIIENDKDYSGELWSWLGDVSFLDRALSNIRHIDVAANLKSGANDLKRLLDKNRPKSSLGKEIAAILKSHSVPLHLSQEVADVVGILTAASMLHDRFAPVLNLAHNCRKPMTPAVDMIRALVGVIRFAENRGKNSSCDKRLTTVQKLELGCGMILDGIDIARALRALESESETAKWIEKAANELKKELFLFDRVNKSIVADTLTRKEISGDALELKSSNTFEYIYLRYIYVCIYVRIAIYTAINKYKIWKQGCRDSSGKLFIYRK